MRAGGVVCCCKGVARLGVEDGTGGGAASQNAEACLLCLPKQARLPCWAVQSRPGAVLAALALS
jgi:hypothetical protein